MTLTLLAALVHQREREITDTLVELLIATVHRIGARAERRVTNELINAFKKVTGKENILFSIAEAALAAPDEAVREVVFPAVAGGEQTLRELVQEFKTKGPVYRRTVQTTLRASYTTRSPPSRRCGSSCGARKSGSSAPTPGATPTRTSPPTSSSAAARTTANCASRWTRACSSVTCAAR